MLLPASLHVAEMGLQRGFFQNAASPQRDVSPFGALCLFSPSPFLRKLKQDCAQTTLQHLGMIPWQDWGDGAESTSASLGVGEDGLSCT